MTAKNKHLQDLKEIRTLMERSSRFISLSGLSGVFAGLYALTGAAAAYFHITFAQSSSVSKQYYEYAYTSSGEYNTDFFIYFILDAVLVLVLSIGTGIFLTTRKAKKQGHSIWDSSAKKLIINLMIPLVAGGLFCLVLLYHGHIGLIAPATLLFYGLALINAGKYTLNDVRYLGLFEVLLGLISSVFIGYGMFFWAIGFGVLHIVYGALMYFKYERQN